MGKTIELLQRKERFSKNISSKYEKNANINEDINSCRQDI